MATAVLGATLWSLQAPQRRGAGEATELYNVDRVSRSEGLAQLPTDYSQLPPTLPPLPPELGEPLPADKVSSNNFLYVRSQATASRLYIKNFMCEMYFYASIDQSTQICPVPKVSCSTIDFMNNDSMHLPLDK